MPRRIPARRCPPGNAGAFGFGSLSLTESLAFGALISAVDPVATLAIFGVSPTLLSRPPRVKSVEACKARTIVLALKPPRVRCPRLSQ